MPVSYRSAEIPPIRHWIVSQGTCHGWQPAKRRLLRLVGLYVDKKDIGHLPMAARAFIAAISVVALAITGHCATHWQSTQMGPFFLYLGMAVLCSNLKVSLPGITGTLSVNYLFSLAAVVELTLAQTVAIGCCSGVAQLFLSARKRPRWVQILFAMAGQIVSGAVTYEVYHSTWLPDVVAFRLFAASAIYFLSNTCTVCAIISLTEGKQFVALWRSTFFWTAPHYLVGGALAGLFHLWNGYAGWQTAVLVFPIAYLLYHSYRLYLGRLAEEKRHVAEVADLHRALFRRWHWQSTPATAPPSGICGACKCTPGKWAGNWESPRRSGGPWMRRPCCTTSANLPIRSTSSPNPVSSLRRSSRK